MIRGKQATPTFDLEKIDLEKLKDMIMEKCLVKTFEMFTALKSLNDRRDFSKAWTMCERMSKSQLKIINKITI